MFMCFNNVVRRKRPRAGYSGPTHATETINGDAGKNEKEKKIITVEVVCRRLQQQH